MAQIGQISEYQAPMIVDNDENAHESGSGSCSDSSSSSAFNQIGLVRLEEDTMEYEFTRKMFAVGMQSAEVVAVHKNMHSGWNSKARCQTFNIFQKAVAHKCGANVGAFGWYGAPRNEICDILVHGFSVCRDTGSYGVGVQLFAGNYCFDGAISSDADEDGVRHILLCRVILGKRELVLPCSRQVNPMTKEFDSGVDSLLNPTRYIIWSSFMNSHIMPVSVVSFKAPAYFKDIPRTIQASAAARPLPRAWVNLTAVLDALAKVVPPPRMVLISKSADDFRAKKINRPQLMKRIRTLAGDKILISVIKNFNKEQE